MRRSHCTTHCFLTPRAPPPHAPRYRPARHANRRKVRPNRVFLQRRRRHRAPWPPASLSRRSSGRATLTTSCTSSSGVWGYRSGRRRSRRRRVLAGQRRAPALSRWRVGPVDRWVPRVSVDCASRSGCTTPGAPSFLFRICVQHRVRVAVRVRFCFKNDFLDLDVVL